MAATGATAPKRPQRLNVPFAEWIVSAAGVGIVGTALAITIYEAVAGDRSPPEIQVAVETISQVRNGYLVKFAATNDGGETAAEVLIHGTISGGSEQEQSEAVLDFLPARSKRHGGLFFRRDPRSGELEIRAAGYRDP